MRYALLLIFILMVYHLPSNAQFSKYIIQLKDKQNNQYSIINPIQYLTARAIDRRTKYNIPIDEIDLPATTIYIDSIKNVSNVTFISVSKWLNQVCISTTDSNALNTINGFSFVASSSAIAAKTLTKSTYKKMFDGIDFAQRPTRIQPQQITDLYNYGSAYNQIHLHNAEFLHNYGFRGEGIQMAMMDAGFNNYTSLITFDSVRNNNQILGTWDFVANNSDVNDDHNHGTKCFSTIAANMPDSFIGTAPKASFYLYRTEDVSSEYPVEEHNWAVAAEKADSLGVDIFSVSLGYNVFSDTTFNHNYTSLNGNTTIMARAANLAAKKGILVVGSAGNDGDNSIHYISTLGDADSVLTIGAVSTTREVGSFSSYGPNSDGQIKPDVAAIGVSATVASSSTGLPITGSGTSFACPIMAGIATCLWQAFPELSNMQLIQEIRKSADKFTQPNDRTGYGIPDIKKAFVNCINKLHTQNASIINCNTILNYTIKGGEEMNVILQRMLPSDTNYTTINTLYFSGSFAKRVFSFTDSLNMYTSGVYIKYRLVMNIGDDTSFYVDSTSLYYSPQCTVINERKICSNASTYFSVETQPFYNYQWQVDAGTGFVNITDNTVYSGSSTSLLILKNMPENYYGNTYRCKQTNGANIIYSNPIKLKFTSTWKGSVSSAWNDERNWDCGVAPTRYVDVLIKSGTPNSPIVNANAECRSLQTLNDVVITVNTGINFNVVGQ